MARWLLAALSLALGAAMLLVFGKTSNQKAIRATKQLLWAHLLELRLYSLDPLIGVEGPYRTVVGNA